MPLRTRADMAVELIREKKRLVWLPVHTVWHNKYEMTMWSFSECLFTSSMHQKKKRSPLTRKAHAMSEPHKCPTPSVDSRKYKLKQDSFYALPKNSKCTAGLQQSLSLQILVSFTVIDVAFVIFQLLHRLVPEDFSPAFRLQLLCQCERIFDPRDLVEMLRVG